VSLNIANTLVESAKINGNRVGLIEAASGKSLRFNELNARADSFAYILTNSGIKAGERIMLMVKPSADFICLTFALFKIGAPVILIDPGMGYKNLLRCIESVRPTGFIGIPKAHLFKSIFRKPFRTIKHSFCCGSSYGLFGPDISKIATNDSPHFPTFEPSTDDLAAIIFTTGSTGPPKGVRYEHSIFQAQLHLIRDYYGIGSGDIDQPAFPLFALFSTALGAQAVIPDMDPTCPAKVNPDVFTASIEKYGVTYSFGSPALWNVIAEHCSSKDKRLKTVKKVLMAGAPVSGTLIAAMQKVLPEDAVIHTPYGATESLPIVSIEGREVIGETWTQTKLGKGTCVGRPLPGIEIAILPICDQTISTLTKQEFLAADEMGEIIVQGDVVTKAYENNAEENKLAKIIDGKKFWHRMGDVGYLDSSGRLWFCGRRAHRVVSRVHNKTFFSTPCEALFNVHPDVFRSALVGVPLATGKDLIPVIIIEPEKDSKINKERLLLELQEIGKKHPLTKEITHYLIHQDFPVDIRHNAKIFREKLSVWAIKELKGNI
jgi:acyl-CoA synthetase (AMP-forming)/AMP-acid ligase II